MGKQRVALSTSDEDEEEAVVFKRVTRSGRDEEEAADRPSSKRSRVSDIEDRQADGAEDMEEEEEDQEEEAKPIGEAVRVSGKGRGRKSHYLAFEYDGNHYDLEDPVLLVPEEKGQKPYVAIIKDITQAKDGIVMVTGQWFYRPEEAEKKGGGNWQSNDTRELFYSFHRDDVPAESVMHKCVVHFVPVHKQIPSRKQHPGFIVQKVYDTVEKKLWKLTDKDYEDNKQHEINLLVQKTMARLVDLPDIITEENADQEEMLKIKRSFRRRNTSPSDGSKEENASVKSDTPGAVPATANEYTALLVQANVLTGDTHRDKWLEKLLQIVHYIWDSKPSEDGNVDTPVASQEKDSKVDKPLTWPDAAISALTSLEQASHDTLAADYQKYNQKMRQLMFNLKTNAFLARRVLSGELEPSKILNMTPTELKEGLTHEETATKEPEELKQIQMTDARCSRCSGLAGVRDIIHAGHGDRYQLECSACGNSWFSSRDAISMLSISTPNSAANVGTAPWATAKFDSVEKQLNSPREPGKPVNANEAFKKSSEAYMPVLERQKSLANKPKTDAGPEPSKKAVDGGSEPSKATE